MPNCKSLLVSQHERSITGDGRNLKKHGDASFHQFLFPAGQGAEGNSGHSNTNISRTCTAVCHCQKSVCPIQTR